MKDDIHSTPLWLLDFSSGLFSQTSNTQELRYPHGGGESSVGTSTRVCTRCSRVCVTFHWKNSQHTEDRKKVNEREQGSSTSTTRSLGVWCGVQPGSPDQAAPPPPAPRLLQQVWQHSAVSTRSSAGLGCTSFLSLVPFSEQRYNSGEKRSFTDGIKMKRRKIRLAMLAASVLKGQYTLRRPC